jgi:hypothetical protein
VNREALLKRLGLDDERLAGFCRRWRIAEMSLFGSVLGEAFGPGSDVDVLVTFEQDAPWDLWDFARLEDEVALLLGRKADVVEASAMRNPFFRSDVMRTREVVYAA